MGHLLAAQTAYELHGTAIISGPAAAAAAAAAGEGGSGKKGRWAGMRGTRGGGSGVESAGKKGGAGQVEGQASLRGWAFMLVQSTRLLSTVCAWHLWL